MANHALLRCACLWLAPAWLFAAEPPPGPKAALAITPPRFSGTPFLTVWRPDDYDAQPENFCVMQHPGTGLIYAGNGGGVLEFDGARWRLLPAPGGGAVIALGVDARGRIWGATAAGVFRLEPDARGQLQARAMNDRLPPGFRLQTILPRIVVTNEGVCFVDRQNLIRFDLDDGPARTWVAAERLVVVTDLGEIGSEAHIRTGAGAFRLRNEKLEPETAPGWAVRAARAEPDGSWRLLTASSTERWAGEKQLSVVPLPRGEGALRAVFLPDGRGVFGTLRSGLFVCDREGQLLQTIGRAQGLPANQVMYVAADREGGVWAAFNNGLARVQLDSPYTVHGPAQGLEGTIQTLARQGERLFVGGTEGAAERGADGRFRALPEVPTVVRELAVHDEWLFLLSTRLRGIRPAVENTPHELENRNYYGLLPLTSQPGWFVHGANEGVRWARFENGTWITQGPLKAFRARANALLESPAGIVWAGYGPAVRRIDFRDGLHADAPAQQFARAEGMPAQPTAMFLIGGKIVALAAGRLVRFDETANRFVPETRIAGLESLVGAGPKPQPIVGAHVATDGTIWLRVGPPSALIGRLVADGADRWRVELLSGEPLRYLRPTTLYHDVATQTLWIGGNGALVARDLTWQPTRPATAPAASIRRIETAAGEVLFGGARAAADPLQLASEQDALRIQFAAPTFAPDRTGLTHTQYRTRLDGLEREWTAWSAQAERHFTNLPWRAFTFRVQARDDGGRVGEEAVLAFSIAPAWWATRWAWAGYGVLGLLGVAGVVRLRTHALHRRAERLEKIVADRTRELAQSNAQLATQNTELARLHRLELDEKIAAQLSEEKARLELLRYQLNPHFLLNAFTTLRSLVFSSPDAAGKTVERLADFCRIALTRTDESKATVGDEVRLIESYLDTEKARWRDELHVEMEIDPAARARPLPTFLLQPLVENAIKYGGRTSPGALSLRVRIACTADGLAIEIANTGEWVEGNSPHRKGSTGIGYENLRQRLHRQYRDAHEFTTEARDGWVFVRLNLKHDASRLPNGRKPDGALA